jgi:hypothetical protein
LLLLSLPQSPILVFAYSSQWPSFAIFEFVFSRVSIFIFFLTT